MGGEICDVEICISHVIIHIKTGEDVLSELGILHFGEYAGILVSPNVGHDTSPDKDICIKVEIEDIKIEDCEDVD